LLIENPEKKSGRKVSPFWNDMLDGAEVEMAGVVLSGADGGLLQADVFRPDGGAGVLGSLRDKAAARKEIDEGRKGGVYEFFAQFSGVVSNLEDWPQRRLLIQLRR
jgi:hypothetical protein